MNYSAYSVLTSANIVDYIGHIFEDLGEQEYLGEAVTMAEHMLQAATIAENRGLSEHIIVAALLHDIGHFTNDIGMFSMDDSMDRFHEDAGATFLEMFLPKTVTDIIRYHVQAKRYLCATSPNYFDRLSPASIHSLNLQGGPMSSSEVEVFKNLINLAEIVEVRKLDDAAKTFGMATPGYSYFSPMIQRLADKHAANKNPSTTLD